MTTVLDAVAILDTMAILMFLTTVPFVNELIAWDEFGYLPSSSWWALPYVYLSSYLATGLGRSGSDNGVQALSQVC